MSTLVPRRVLLAALLGLLAAPRARANVVTCGPSIAPGTICLEGNVVDGQDGPLIPGQVYVVTSFITVPAGQSLTTDGAILKFGNNAHLSANGTLSAVGTTFTSIHDDAAGGDTNTNGGTTLPAAGDWSVVLCGPGADASVFDTAVFTYADAGLSLNAADATVRSCQFRDLVGFGLNAQGNSLPSVTGCTFVRCGRPITNARVVGLPLFAGNTAQACTSSNSIDTFDGVVDANTVVAPQNATNGDGVFIIANVGAGTVVDPGVTLTLQPGVVFKLNNGPAQTITVNGTLDANGVTFTSIHDDTVGGDTNQNGAATMPAPADWRNITFNGSADASVLRNTTLRYGGGAVPVSGGPMIILNQADVTLDGVIVELGRADALNLTGSSFPTVTGCVFRNNLGQPLRRAPIEALPGFSDNAATGNGVRNAVLLELAPEDVAGNVVLAPANTFNGDGVIVLGTNLDVVAGSSLTLSAGMAVKARPSFAIDVSGTLTCLATEFTSIHDDTIAGDTELDGAANLPAPGDWDGLVFHPGSNASTLAGGCVRYAGKLFGGSGNAAIDLRFGASPTLTNLLIDFSEQAALDLSSACFPQVSGCSFLLNGAAVIGVPIAAVEGFSSNDAAGNAQGDYLEISQGTVSAGEGVGCVSVSPASALNQDGVFVLTAAVVVQDGACLSVDGGCILKIAHTGAVTVDGTLVAGASGTPTFFTRVEDDSVGGDTTKDGGASSPDPGDWIGLVFNATSAACVLDDVVVRWAGRQGASVRLVGGIAPSFADTVIRDGQGHALQLAFGARPSVVNCSFVDCDFAVSGVSINAVPGFVDNVASGNTNGDYLQVVASTVSGDVLVRRSNALNGGPFVVAGTVTVPAGATLRLGGGTIFKWNGAFGLAVDGTLLTLGSLSVPVQLTSVHDDVTGGDTNKNGNATGPAPGDWNNVDLTGNSDASLLSGAVVKYAGRFGLSAIDLAGADVTLVECRVQHALADALDLSGNSFPEVRRSAFDDSGGVAVDNVPLGAIAGFMDNTANGNALLDAMRVTSFVVTAGPSPEGVGGGGAVEVAKASSLNGDGVFVVSSSTATVAAGSRLVLRPGVILKFTGTQTLVANGGLDLDGSGFEPVVLTSIEDDASGGDTNKDGAATAPAPGDWGGVSYPSSTEPSRAAHATVRYAGATGGAGLSVSSSASQVALLGVRVEHALADGFRLSGLAGDAVDLVAFQCGGDGIELLNGAFDVLFATVAACGGTGILAQPGHQGGLSSAISFGNAVAQSSGFALGEVFFSDVGPTYAGANGNLDADPLFLDLAQGDLRLGAGSPCLNAGEFAVALLAQVDRDERSRALDHDLSGAMLPDMGAYERAVYELTASGPPGAGSILAFTVTGPPGVATFELATTLGLDVQDPLGFVTLGRDRRVVQVLPVGQTLHLPVPSGFAGAFAVQATARSDADPGRGNVTQRYRAQAPQAALGVPGVRGGPVRTRDL